MTTDDIGEHCRQLAAPAGSTAYYATLFLPPRERCAWLGAHALAEDLRRIVGTVRDTGVALLRLKWWAEQIDRIQTSPHPVAMALAPLIIRGHMPASLPLALIQQAERHLTAARSTTLTDNYTADGTLWLWSGSLCGPLTDRQSAGAERLGRLAGLLYDVQNLRPLMQLERYPIPGLTSLEVNRRSDLRSIIAGINTALTDCGQEIDHPGNGNPCLTACRITRRLLSATVDEILRDGCRLLEKRVTLTPIRKLWIAWRVKRSHGSVR